MDVRDCMSRGWSGGLTPAMRKDLGNESFKTVAMGLRRQSDGSVH